MARAASRIQKKVDWVKEENDSFTPRRVLIADLGLALLEVAVQWVKQGLLSGLDGERPAWIGLIAAIALLMWNTHLFIAIGLGLAAMVLIYRLHQRLGPVSWQVSHWLSELSRPMAIPLAGGGLVTLSTYVTLSIWQDLGSPWIALTLALQSLGILAILGLLVWQLLNQQQDHGVSNFDRWVRDLIATDPLRQLIAVRQIHQCAQSLQLDSQQRQMATEYLQLLLQRESEMVVHHAALEGLQFLNKVDPAEPPHPPRQPLKRMRMKHRRPVVPASSVKSLS